MLLAFGLTNINLSELLKKNAKTIKIRINKLLKNQKDLEEILYYSGILYIVEILHFELISFYYNNPITGSFKITKIYTLIVKKYH